MIFNDFQGGIADSILRGIKGSFATLVGLNIHDTPGLLTVNQKLTNNSTSVISEFCKEKVAASDGNTYFFSVESGKIWKKTSADVYTLVHTNTKGACIGAKEYDGYIYYVGAGFVGRQSVANAASEASWSSQDDDWQALTNSDSEFGPMEEVNGNLYIGNGNLLASYDGTTFELSALDLPSQYRIKCLYPYGIEILLGTYVGTSAATKRFYATVVRWGTVDPDSWNDSDIIWEDGINAFIPADNQVYVQAGSSGNIYYYNGSQLLPYKFLPGTFTATAYGLVYPNAVGFFRSLPIFGFSNSPDTANSSGNPCNLGIYSLGGRSTNYSKVLNLEYPLSVFTPLSGVEIGCIVVAGLDLYASWRKKVTATMTIADPAVVTITAHGLANGTPIRFTTTGALPTGVTAGTVYYARSTATNTFNLYDTAAHAVAGGATGRVVTSGTQSGVHTATICGIDKIDYTAKYASAYLETLVYNTGNFSKKVFEMFAGYSSMPASCALTFKYKKNYASIWTNAPTAANETELNLYRTKDTLHKCRTFQQRIDFTISSNNAPVLDYFGFSDDE